MNKIYSNKNKIYSNKNKIYRNTHVNIQKSTTVLEDPGTQQRCFRMCGTVDPVVGGLRSGCHLLDFVYSLFGVGICSIRRMVV